MKRVLLILFLISFIIWSIEIPFFLSLTSKKIEDTIQSNLSSIVLFNLGFIIFLIALVTYCLWLIEENKGVLKLDLTQGIQNKKGRLNGFKRPH